MNEIEKLYELVGINKKCIDKRYEKCTGVCYDCVHFQYPPFTAEKQLSLLQVLARIESADYFQFFFYEIKQEWIFRLNMLTELSCESAYIYESRNKNFDECIAGLINIIWQDLTEEECKQIREILK